MNAHARQRTRRRESPKWETGTCHCGRTTIDELVSFAVRRARRLPTPDYCPHCGAELPKIPLGVFRQIAVSD